MLTRPAWYAAQELGIEDRVVWNRVGSKIFTLRNKKIHALPRSPFGLLTTGALVRRNAQHPKPTPYTPSTLHPCATCHLPP